MHYYITTALQQFSSFGSRRLLAPLLPLNKTLLQIWIYLYIQIELDDEFRLSQALSVDKQSGIHENLLHLHACTQHSSYKYLLTNPIDQLTFNLMYAVYHTGQHQKILNKWRSNL